MFGLSPLESIELMPVTYTTGHGWELHDFHTGEIFEVPSEKAGKALRALSIRTGRIPYDFAQVRSLAFNGIPSYI